MRQAAERFARSFVFAWAGIRYVLRTQPNMRVHLAIGFAVVVLGWWLRLTAVEWSIVAITMALVFVLEMLNTVIERVVSLSSPHFHPLAQQAKDVAAGAVLTGAIFAAAVGALIFLPRLLR